MSQQPISAAPAPAAPDATPFPRLFAPLRIGPLELRNRIVIPAHTMLLGERDGTIGDRYRAYLVERAVGGAAVVGVESAPVHPGSLSFPQQIRLWDPAVQPGIARAAQEVRAAGAFLSVMLWHGGRNVPHLTGNVPASASAIPSLQMGDTPRVLDASELPAIVRAYADAARLCADAGVELFEVQTASDYLLGSFLSSRLNRRTDRYGGSLENRARLALEVLQAVRDAVGRSIALGVRTSVSHLLPLDPAGYGIEESLPLMQLIAGSGLVDYVSLMTGSNGVMNHTIPPMGTQRAMLAHESAQFRRALPVPVFVAGRIKTPDEAERVLEEGGADAVAMARALIADPYWPAKARRGASAEIRPCMSCNQACLGFANRMMPAGCVVNASAGFELVLPSAARPVARTRDPKRVAVVGGGPAGLEAARTLAERGHAVHLYEAAPVLGGAFRLAADAPHREEMLPAIDWWTRELARLGVRVSLSTRIAAPQDVAADEVIWATGAQAGWTMLWKNRPQLVGGLPGAEALPHGRDVLAGRVGVRGRVLVVDEEGGWPAVSLVDSLVARADVTSVVVATSALLLGGLELGMTAEAYSVADRVRRAGVEVLPTTFVERVEGREAIALDGRRLGPFDAFVLSMGAVARGAPAGTTAIGDCVAPRGLWAAVQEGARAGAAL